MYVYVSCWQPVWVTVLYKQLMWLIVEFHISTLTASHHRTVIINRLPVSHKTVIINRLQVSHTHLNHWCLLWGDNQPTCSTCGHPLTVRHILLDCRRYLTKRLFYYLSRRIIWNCWQLCHHWFYQRGRFIAYYSICFSLFVTFIWILLQYLIDSVQSV